MTPTPRLLLTIDYESWFASSRQYDSLPPEKRRVLDGGYAQSAVDPILKILGDNKVSFYLVGELVEWYPDLPQKILSAGHEVGFHCQVHRPLDTFEKLEQDVKRSESWRKEYHVVGYRAPMINMAEASYQLLNEHGFLYSSSIYAPTGKILKKNGVWEIPASTLPLLGPPADFRAPRRMDLTLVAGGEFPYASSFMSGLFPKTVFKIIERQLKAGLSPVIFLHPYEIFPPEDWPKRFQRDLIASPILLPFTLNKSAFLKELLQNFPVSTMETFVHEVVHERSES